MRTLACSAALASLVTQAGCALLASGNAQHSQISPCVSDLQYSALDMILAAGATAVLVGLGKVDESPAWMAVPGVFVASGVIGAISVHRCRRGSSGDAAPAMLGPSYPPAAPLDPQRGRAQQGDAQRGEQEGPGVLPLEDLSPAARAREQSPLRLPSDSPLANPPAPPAGDVTKLECGPALPSVCPEGHSCRLVSGQLGSCVADPPKAPARPKAPAP